MILLLSEFYQNYNAFPQLLLHNLKNDQMYLKICINSIELPLAFYIISNKLFREFYGIKRIEVAENTAVNTRSGVDVVDYLVYLIDIYILPDRAVGYSVLKGFEQGDGYFLIKISPENVIHILTVGYAEGRSM